MKCGHSIRQQRTLRDTTVTVCLACDWAQGGQGPRQEFEPVAWPPKATERGK